MLYELENLYGLTLSATDADIGYVKDFYFDDQTWCLRYVVVDTGNWLSERQVLLAPKAFDHGLGNGDQTTKHLHVNLTRQQISDSPPIETHRSITRQYEDSYYRYYGWPNYWDGGMLGSAGFPAFTPLPLQDHTHHGHNQRDDQHLRSTEAVAGYRVHGTDGEVGRVNDFVLNGKDFTIQEIIVETGSWLEDKRVRILTKHIERVSYEESAVYVKLSKADLAGTETEEVVHAGGK